MKIPALLLTRPAYIAYAAVAVVAAGMLWWHAQIKHAEQRGALEAEVRQTKLESARQDSVNAVLRDSLAESMGKTDTVTVYTQAAVNSYQRARAAVNTAPSAQPAGTPPGKVLVDVLFVSQADSLARLVVQLMAAAAAERAASERRIAGLEAKVAIQDTLNAQLQRAVDNARPKFSDKVKYAGIGGAIVGTAFVVLRLSSGR